MTGGNDHQAHSVAGGKYTKVDYEGAGKIGVTLDGTKSHSHYFNPSTQMSGKIVSYQWKAKGKVIGTTAKLNAVFSLGQTNVQLVVTDNTGDVACDTAIVTGLPSQTAGAFCYFYPGATALPPGLNTFPKPTDGVKVTNLNFPTLASFPFAGKAAATWAMRCITNLDVGNSAEGTVAIQRQGRIAFADVESSLQEGPGEGGSGLAFLGDAYSGMVPFMLVYHKSGPTAQFQLLLNGVPAKGSQLSFSQSNVLPIVTSISPATAETGGGGTMQVFGQGFVNGPEVFVGGFKAKVDVASSKQLLVTVPSLDDAGSAEAKVYVSNQAGQSNSKTLVYSNGGGPTTPAPPPAPGAPGAPAPPTVAAIGSTTIKWQSTFFKTEGGGKASLPLLTSVAVGPDFAYYFGSQDGFVHKVSVLKDLAVLSKCKSFALGLKRSVLGIAFNPWKKEAQPYVSTSTLKHQTAATNSPLKGKVNGWANGQIEKLFPGCGCFCSKIVIISGLPVSNFDHSVNALQFLLNGDLLISVAGTTNGGDNTQMDSLGGVKESPLSAAILLAKTSKGDSIDGKITYDQYSNPTTAVRIGAADVIVFATGLRNSFGMTLTRAGNIYATDNGHNAGFGKKSTGCTTQVEFTNKGPDELNLIIKGGHYGHPNRNRGFSSPKECVWGTGLDPVATFSSATTGIMEYISNAFGGKMKGDLVATMYSTNSAAFQGAANRLELSGNGNVKNKYKMATYSGLSATNGLFGEIVMPRVGKNEVVVLKPVYTPPVGPYVVAVTPKIGQGGQKIMVTGNGFKVGLTATVGGKPCAPVTEVGDASFKCVTPAGSGLVAVQVMNPGGVKSAKFSGDFLFL